MVMDEFPLLGRLAFFEKSLRLMSGYGIKAMFVAQSLNDIVETYGPHNTILDNCAVYTAFSALDPLTQEKVSRLTGSVSELRTSRSGPAGLGGGRSSVSRSQTDRPLLEPGEVRALPDDQQLVFVAGHRPLRTQKLLYDRREDRPPARRHGDQDRGGRVQTTGRYGVRRRPHARRLGMIDPPIAAERKLEALRHALGPIVLAALKDPAVVEIMANPDGRLVLDRMGEGRLDTGERLSAEARDRSIKLVADHVGEEVARENPRLSGVLPHTGERFQGLLPPIVSAPAFSIRKRPAVIWALADYVRDGVMTGAQASDLRQAIMDRKNILISGGTGSGKTTLANALLAEPAFANDRVFLIEDTPELQCSAWDTVAVQTRRIPSPIGVGDLVRDALRMRPDRIVVGEMRDGSAALETLKAWNTGHPGGLSTIHANSGDDVARRIADLIGEVAARVSRSWIADAVDLVVHIRRETRGRVVDAFRVER